MSFRRRMIQATGLVLLATFPVDAVAQVPTDTLPVISGEDRALAWTARELFSIGPDLDGSTAFFRVFPWTIDSDRNGRIYVLDVGNYVVRVFDSEGQFLSEFGGRGGGPDEFERPVGLAVDENGSLVIADVGKASLLRMDRAGNLLEQTHRDGKLGPIATAGPALLVSSGWGGEVYRLDLILEDGTTTTLADLGEPGMVRYPDCKMSVPGRPFFAPVVTFSAAGDRFAFNRVPEYEIAVFSGAERGRLIRRAVEPIQIEEREALDSKEVQLGFRITWGSNKCEISPRDVLEARGYAHQISPVLGISIRPDGQLWVSRRTKLDGKSRIDVISRAGEYLGTLPEDFPFPTAWQSQDQYLVYGVSPVGIPYLTAFEIGETRP